MVKAQKVQDRGVQVMSFNHVFNRFESELISRTVNRTPFYATSRHPYRESIGIMIPPQPRLP